MAKEKGVMPIREFRGMRIRAGKVREELPPDNDMFIACVGLPDDFAVTVDKHKYEQAKAKKTAPPK